MRKHVSFIGAVTLAAVAFSGCPKMMEECINGDEPVCDTGMLPPDYCNTIDEAKGDPAHCSITIATGGAMPTCIQDVYISRLADGGVDQDWYTTTAPAGLTARSLLHVNGGYRVPQTAVNFSLNVLRADNQLSVANGIDKHGAAAPKPIDLIVPFSDSNAALYVLVADEAGGAQAKVDNRNAYTLCMEMIENPDVNEPNDSTATVIALSAGTSGVQGSQAGYLATNDDVDLYSFDVTSAGRQIIYLHIGEDTSAGPHPTNPPPPFRLQYTLLDPMGGPISEGVMDNEFQEIDLATARLAPMTGTYKVQISGFKAQGQMTPVKGDLRLKYTVNVQVLPDLDMTEPNDTVATAKAVTLSPNGSTTLVGKLAHVPDEEWFHITLPARASPSTLRYRVTAATTGGRYPPLSMTPARQLRVVQPVTSGATPQDRQTACKTNRTLCPWAEDVDPALNNAICASNDPPFCLWAQRSEELPALRDIKNLVGAIPIAANTASEWYVMFRDEGLGAAKYADDRDWTMVLEWRDDADEAMRLGGPAMASLSGATTVSTGELTFGYGKYLDPDWFMPTNTNRLRGLNDYDAVDTDKDRFQYNLGGLAGDQSWEISWDLDHVDGGMDPPGELAFEFTFCGGSGTSDAGLCAGGQRRIFAFNDQSLTPWYLPQSASNGRMLFTKQNMATYTTYSATPVGCTCLSSARVGAGVFFADVAAVHRLTNDPIRYRVSQRVTAYPGSFTVDGGGTAMCPVADGGCGFAQ